MHLQKVSQLPTLAKMLSYWFQTAVGIHTSSLSPHHANTKDALETGVPPVCACTSGGKEGHQEFACVWQPTE